MAMQSVKNRINCPVALLIAVLLTLQSALQINGARDFLTQETRGTRPNVILIFLDDTGTEIFRFVLMYQTSQLPFPLSLAMYSTHVT